ncbi:zinc-dependent metalloprotease family protein [Arthrobacter sp. zg-Y179]|uniref:zinc-dependent metalloprotease family protein n=1 Tax=Arthrobacter sp. zg-Y179 TaxID=2894188 RepID=UPI001E6529C3|nr:zinc-dependent metalloprotease family protein [Arthrobacter sp. zg-Y179]MCC9174388.1 hypothetical protein [Arthrobacter sp. zg-Y179]
MKSVKLAVLALIAASLTAGGLPAQEFEELPQPAVTDAAGPGARSTVPSPATAEDPEAAPASPAPAVSTPNQPAPAVTEPPAEPTDPAPAVPAPDSATTSTDAAEQPQDGDGYDPVVGGGFPVPGPNTPLVTDPDGTVRSAVETDISAMHDHGAASFSTRSGGASTTGAAARSGTIQVTLVFATLTDNRGGVDQQAAKNSITAANNYWRAASNQRLGMSIAETKTLNSTANSGQDYGAMMNTIRKDLRWYDTPNEALVVFVPAGDLRSGGYGGILGGGWTSGPTSGSVLMPRPSGFTNNVVTHELGHVLGLLHANSLKCNNGRSDIWINSAGNWADGACTSREYGDTSDLMGYAQYNMPMISSYFWDSGAFGRGDEILNAGTPGQAKTYTLRPWAGSASNRAVKFRDTSGETYYLELRQPVGYDAGTAVGGNRGVKIVKADLANSWAVNSLIIAPNTRDFAGYTNANSTWQAGQTFVAHTGTTVKINSINSDSASVTIVGGATARALAPIAQMRAAHPELGAATSEVTGGLRNNGAHQNFKNGVILWSPESGAFISMGAVRSFYGTLGYQNGFLGYPTSNEVATAGGSVQTYQGGRIIWSPKNGASYVLGAVGSTYINKGGPAGSLGFPKGNERLLSNGGVVQSFDGGSIYWSPATGARVVGGAVLSYYNGLKSETGFLGYPISEEVHAGGGAVQSFQGGAIAWSPATGSTHLYKGMAVAYTASGGGSGPLGFPTGAESGLPTRGGAVQPFQKGALYWSPKTGAVVVKDGPIREAYTTKGAQAGFLGYPRSATTDANGGSSQVFENGRLTWTKAAGIRTVYSGMEVGYASLGGPSGSLGYPTGDETGLATSGGAVQQFERGTMYWSPATGSVGLKTGPAADAYRKEGAEKSFLGYPTSPETAVAGGTIQSFQYGRIAWSPSTGAALLYGAVDASYKAANGPAGPLGFPTGNEGVSANGTGSVQNFQYGSMYWSPSTGARFVGGAVKTAYLADDGEKGFLRFPTTNEKATAGGVIQDFEGGSVLWSSRTGAYPVFGAVKSTYLGNGGAAGQLGFPIGRERSTGTNQSVQQFQNGSIQWSASGGSRIIWK